MSLETVVEDIQAEARARAEEILEEAEAEAEEIVNDAKAEADEVLAARERRAERRVEQEREQRLSSARLEAKQELLEARREVLADVRASTEDRIAGLEGDRRRELTVALLDDAASEFEDAETVHVYGREDDEELLLEILEGYDGFEHAGEYACLGGVVVESGESRIRVNNTFDSILEDVWNDDLKEISRRLFENGQ